MMDGISAESAATIVTKYMSMSKQPDFLLKVLGICSYECSCGETNNIFMLNISENSKLLFASEI